MAGFFAQFSDYGVTGTPGEIGRISTFVHSVYHKRDNSPHGFYEGWNSGFDEGVLQ